MGSLQIDGGGVPQGKCYWCKYCGMAFSDGRVLGGHVRSHMAAEGLTRRSKKLAIDALGECLEGGSSGRSFRGEHSGYSLRKNHNKPRKLLGMSEERRECSPRGKNRCGICDRGFRTSRALFGHMRLHLRMESSVAGSDHGEMGYSDTRASLEELMPDYEEICHTKTKKRSVGARSNENLQAKDLSLSAFFAGGIHQDEFEAAICLLMFSRGVKHSDAVTGFWASSPPLVKNEDDFDDSEASDGFDLGVSNKRRRVGDIVNAAVELQEVSGRLGSFSTCSNSGGKLMEYGISFNMVSSEIEVQSPQRMDNVKDLARDSVEVYKVAEPTVSGQLGGECKKKHLLGSDTGKYNVPLKKEGYKCKDCGKIFAIHQALGGHRAKFKSGSCRITEKSENDAVNEKDAALCTPPEEEVAQVVSVTEAALRQPDHKCPTCGEVFSSGQALGGHKRRHYSKQRCHREQE